MNATKGFGILMIIGGISLGGCNSKKDSASAAQDIAPVVATKTKIIGGAGEVRAVPHATVFRMNGNYADNVAITLNADGSLAYYPDPLDISDNSAPYYLGNGWYLNRQGIGPDSRFTSFSFSAYRDLKKTPSHSELKNSIIPGAEITEFIELPVTYSEALANPEICNKYLPN